MSLGFRVDMVFLLYFLDVEEMFILVVILLMDNFCYFMDVMVEVVLMVVVRIIFLFRRMVELFDKIIIGGVVR